MEENLGSLRQLFHQLTERQESEQHLPHNGALLLPKAAASYCHVLEAEMCSSGSDVYGDARGLQHGPSSGPGCS